MKKRSACLRALGCLLALLLLTGQLFAQSSKYAVKGVVQNEKNEPLAGVTVTVSTKKNNFSLTTQTDEKGLFSFNKLQDGQRYRFVLTYAGYEKKLLDGYSYNSGELITLSVQLLPAATVLNDVVVVGYGTQKKANLTGSVSQVGGEVFDNRSLPNLSQGLQGVVPNLNIVPNDGKPTQAPAFNVRGTTSIGQGGSALVLIDGVEGNPSLINPNDVASVTVLKDAASAAIYGARGAFGVVLITTKSPVKDRFNVTFGLSHSVKKPTTVPDVVTNGYTYAKNFNEAWTAWNDYSQSPQNINKTVKFSQAYLDEFARRDQDPSLPKVEVNAAGEYVYYANTDWYHELYKNSLTADEYNLALSGNTGKAGYVLTGRYMGQNGLFRYNSDDYKMYNFRAKGYIQVYPWLRIDNNTTYSNMKYHNPLNVGEGGSIWRNISDEGHPNAPLLNPDGSLSYSAAYTVGDFYFGKNGIDFNNRVMRNTSGFTAQFFNNHFRVKGDFTFQNTDNNQQQLRVQVPYSRKPGVVEYVGTNTNDLKNTYGSTEYLAANIYSEYEDRFKGGHYFKALVGYNYEQSTYKGFSVQRNGLIYNGATDINLALGQAITTNGGYEKWNILGGFFRLNYAFRDRYLLEVNGRYDGSSKFPSDQRYAFFPSVSAGWRVSKEDFWDVDPKIISDLKVRGSYGSLGNGSIGSYAFQEKFAISQSGRILGGVRPQQTSQPGVLPNGLTWETSTTQNIGLDMALLDSRLKFSGDAYIRKTKDMFTVGMTLPAVFGTDVPKGNYADLKTKGWEVSVAWNDVFKVAAKPFTYGVQVTMADYTAEITKYNNPDKKLSDYYAGQKLGEIWGFQTAGFFTSTEDIAKSPKQTLYKASTSGQLLPGDIKFADRDGSGIIDNGDNTVGKPGDRYIIGNSTPRYTYGINLNAGWNGFFVAAFFQGVGKQDWWPGSEAGTFWGQYNRPYNNMPTYMLGKIWSAENPNTYFPRYRGYVAQNSQGELAQQQTRYLQHVRYIRLKNLQIGYNLPSSVTRKLSMSSARVYVSGENLWCKSPLYKLTRDLDVESIRGSDRDLTDGSSGNGNNYPILKSLTFGLSVTF